MIRKVNSTENSFFRLEEKRVDDNKMCPGTTDQPEKGKF